MRRPLARDPGSLAFGRPFSLVSRTTSPRDLLGGASFLSASSFPSGLHPRLQDQSTCGKALEEQIENRLIGIRGVSDGHRM